MVIRNSEEKQERESGKRERERERERANGVGEIVKVTLTALASTETKIQGELFDFSCKFHRHTKQTQQMRQPMGVT